MSDISLPSEPEESVSDTEDNNTTIDDKSPCKEPYASQKKTQSIPRSLDGRREALTELRIRSLQEQLRAVEEEEVHKIKKRKEHETCIQELRQKLSTSQEYLRTLRDDIAELREEKPSKTSRQDKESQKPKKNRRKRPRSSSTNSS